VPDDEPESAPGLPEPADERSISTGFRALDAIIGLGGLPRTSATALHGDGTSGKTTLALRAVAQVQAAGGIAAYLDLARSLDPVEAVSRGVQLEWLVVLTPDSLEEALSMAAMLLQDRTVDLLLLDLPPLGIRVGGVRGAPEGRAASRAAGPEAALGGTKTVPAASAAVLGERIHRLAALARRAGVQMLVLEPPSLPAPITGAFTQITSLRLELSRRAWIRLGRDVVGQRTEVRVARDRFGPPGRVAELRIMYAEGGPRDACLARDELLREAAPGTWKRLSAAPAAASLLAGVAPPGGRGPAAGSPAVRPPLPFTHPLTSVPANATPASLLAPSPHTPGHHPFLHSIRGGADRFGRQTLDGRSGSGREQVGIGAGDKAGHAARDGSPAGAGSAVHRSGSGG
jgi:hypothetical protein